MQFRDSFLPRVEVFLWWTRRKKNQKEKGEMPMVAGRLQEKNGFYYT